MAEAHPVGFQWVMEAKARGATVIHIDPRFSRTSALADLYVPIRAGTDIAFLGGIVSYVLEHGREFRDYVASYTNAAAIIGEQFADTEDLDGLFSGFQPEQDVYDPASWQYEGLPPPPGTGREGKADAAQTHGSGGSRIEAAAAPHTDPTLQHPRCVFQLLRKHYRRYTPELVEQVCGIPKELFLRVAETWCANSGRERTSALVYSVGWTQHSVGVQYIRTGSIIQLLLGNVGRPGGGVLALRGHASIQGSTDIPTLYNILPGYLPMPHVADHAGLRDYLDVIRLPGGFWGHCDAYMVSLLKAYWGEAATADNDWCFDYLPKLSGDHSAYVTAVGMLEGTVKGYFLLGENPAVGNVNGGLHRKALASLDWLVVRDLVEIESASFWRDGPEVQTGELRTEQIPTEVFLLPAAAHTEKDGTFTNTQRLLQWHHKAVEAPGDCRSELWFMYHLGRLLRDQLAGSGDPKDRPVQDLAWEYPISGPHAEPSAEAVLREISGYDAAGKAVSGYTELKDDGSTTCGCWIYSGVYADEVNQAARRKPGREQSWVAPEWGWAWPYNRRILYNRASADPEGRPWSQRKAYVWWDQEQDKWTGHDVPDFVATMRPNYQPPEGSTAEKALSGSSPFVMQADGKGWLFAPNGLVDGPLPTHYEPHESPFANPLYQQQANPTRQRFDRPGNPYNPSGEHADRDAYPFVVTTYRLTEHHTAGGMSRHLPYLAELQPEMFCEVSPELAELRGLANGGWATIVTARTAIEARVLVTRRMRPLRVDGRQVHQIGLPYHWGWRGLVAGDAANDLFPVVLDPNVHIQESKAATCDIRPGRRPRGPELLELVERRRPASAETHRTGPEETQPHKEPGKEQGGPQ
jgi:formate dehydrogenase major subunit